MNQPCLYHIEDNEADRRLLAYALEAQDKSIHLHNACDGEHAIELLRSAVSGERCRPDLIILDLNLPKRSGIEVLASIRRDPDLQSARVVVLTSSDSPTDRSASERYGISAYLQKPMTFDGFLVLGGQLLQIANAPW